MGWILDKNFWNKGFASESAKCVLEFAKSLGAKKMIAHFNAEINCDNNFIKKLNGFLPNDIVILDIRKTMVNAHARFDALQRQYEYHVYTEKNPFLEQFAHRIPSDTDFEKMNFVAKHLFEYTDFTSFSKLHTKKYDSGTKPKK